MDAAIHRTHTTHSPHTASLATGRTLEIDGIRGWAAVIVVLYHVFVEMLGNVLPAAGSPLTRSLLNGHMAVFVFFILSGDALSSPFFSRHDVRSIDRLALKRYFRLTIPIFMSCVGVWAIMVAGLDYHLDAMKVLGNSEWLGPMLQVDHSLHRVLKYVFYGVYAEHTMAHSYNPFLWTMSFEMVGSFIVFLFCYACRSLKAPTAALIFAASALLVLNSFYFLFIFGMLLSHARSIGWLDRIRRHKASQPLALAAIALLLALIAFKGSPGFAWPTEMLFCATVVLAIYTSNGLRRFFSNGPSRLLGRISFPLYLTQFWVLIFPMSWLVTHPGPLGALPPELMYLSIAVVCLTMCLAIACLFEACEAPLLRWLDRALRRRVMRPVPA